MIYTTISGPIGPFSASISLKFMNIKIEILLSCFIVKLLNLIQKKIHKYNT